MAKKAIIHVNKNVIAKNRDEGTNFPVLTVKRGGETTYAHEVNILGPSKIVHSPHKPLSCGARVWIETTSEIELVGETAKFREIYPPKKK